MQFPDGEGGSESLVEFMQLEWQRWDVSWAWLGLETTFFPFLPLSQAAQPGAPPNTAESLNKYTG